MTVIKQDIFIKLHFHISWRWNSLYVRMYTLSATKSWNFYYHFM